MSFKDFNYMYSSFLIQMCHVYVYVYVCMYADPILVQLNVRRFDPIPCKRSRPILVHLLVRRSSSIYLYADPILFHVNVVVRSNPRPCKRCRPIQSSPSNRTTIQRNV